MSLIHFILILLVILDYNVCNQKTLEKKTQNYTVSFKIAHQKNIGLIRKIYLLDHSVYFVIQNFTKFASFSKDNILENYLNEFFLISSLTNIYELIKIEYVLREITIGEYCQRTVFRDCPSDVTKSTRSLWFLPILKLIWKFRQISTEFYVCLGR